MTTITEIELNCPCCEFKFQTAMLMSTNTFGPRTTDFWQQAAGDQPLKHIIHTCPQCGYTGFDDDFEEAKIDNKTKGIINQRLTPLVKDENAFPGRRYEYAAWIAEWKNDPSIKIGHIYLRAAWCCYDDERAEDEKYYRLKAIEYFEKALREKDIENGQIAFYTYLIGELYRRIGEQDNAAIWFDRVESVAGKQESSQWLVKLGSQQKLNPKEFIDKE